MAAGIKAAADAGGIGATAQPKCRGCFRRAFSTAASAPCHRQPEVMGFLKFSPFLALSILVLYQADSLHAVPFRSVLESSPDLATLSEEEARLLLAALVQDYVQMKASELEQQQETEGSSLASSRSKRCGNLSTCMLGTYTQDLNKFHTFPQTAIGVGAPGKKRDMANNLDVDHRPQFGMPQNTN
ncbi:calcitonin isoform X1 [Oryctolagus cuniculus]|uniref:calcitonin isoform X1 n=2 Tax=Oryctolagus cuniculus TaxID=9986 RepID=UPI00387A2355